MNSKIYDLSQKFSSLFLDQFTRNLVLCQQYKVRFRFDHYLYTTDDFQHNVNEKETKNMKLKKYVEPINCKNQLSVSLRCVNFWPTMTLQSLLFFSIDSIGILRFHNRACNARTWQFKEWMQNIPKYKPGVAFLTWQQFWLQLPKTMSGNQFW